MTKNGEQLGRRTTRDGYGPLLDRMYKAEIPADDRGVRDEAKKETVNSLG